MEHSEIVSSSRPAAQERALPTGPPSLIPAVRASAEPAEMRLTWGWTHSFFGAAGFLSLVIVNAPFIRVLKLPYSNRRNHCNDFPS